MKFPDIKKYYIHIIAVCVAVICVAFGLLGWNFYEDFQNEEAEKEIYPYRNRLIKAEKKAGGEVYSASSSFFALKKAEDVSAFSKELEDYKNFLLSRKSYRVAHFIASIELAYFLIQYGQQKEALSLLETISSQSSSKGWIYHTMLYQLGIMFMDQKNYTRALHFFSSVASNEKSSPFQKEVFLKIALCYEEMGEIDKAQKIYDELRGDEEDGLYQERAVHYDRLMQVKRKARSVL